MTVEENFERELSRLRPLWKKISDPEVNYHFQVPDVLVKDMFLAQVARYPDKVFVYSGEKTYTYSEVNALAVAVANGLLERGIKKGERVITFLSNSAEFIAIAHASFKLGTILVNSNPRCTADEAYRRIVDCTPSIVFVDSISAPMIIEAMTKGEHTVQETIFCPAIDSQTSEEGITAWEDALSKNEQEPCCELSYDDILVLQYTGGTTGVIKGCCQTNHAFVAKAYAQMEYFKPILTEEDTENYMVLMGLGLSHAFGFAQSIVVNLSFGGSVYFADSLDGILSAIEKYKPTVWPSVPVWIKQIAGNPEYQKYNLSSLKCITCGAAPLPVDVLRKVEELTGATITEGYGMTETVNTITINSFCAHKEGTVGVPNPNIEYIIVDQNDGVTVMPEGELGEIICRGECVMRQYWQKPEETAHALRNGWLYTGDIGKVDSKGYLTIVDRKKDMIIVSGFNVYPREIEDVVMQVNGVIDACAIGISHAKRGEAPAVYYVVNTDVGITKEQIAQHCRKHLSGFKVPVEYYQVDEIPKTINRKPDRKRLKALHEQRAI